MDVNIAARVADGAGPSELLISEAALERDRPLEGEGAASASALEAKGVPEDFAVYAVAGLSRPRRATGAWTTVRSTTSVSIPLAEIELRASRSSGPGGQHANVTASRIEAVFDVDASPTLSDEQRRRLREKLGDQVTAVAQDARSQARNRELAARAPPREARPPA